MQKNPNRQSRWYFGGIASAGAACCTHPLDLLKVHLQTGSGVASAAADKVSSQVTSKANVSLIGHVTKVWVERNIQYNHIHEYVILILYMLYSTKKYIYIYI